MRTKSQWISRICSISIIVATCLGLCAGGTLIFAGQWVASLGGEAGDPSLNAIQWILIVTALVSAAIVGICFEIGFYADIFHQSDNQVAPRNRALRFREPRV